MWIVLCACEEYGHMTKVNACFHVMRHMVSRGTVHIIFVHRRFTLVWQRNAFKSRSLTFIVMEIYETRVALSIFMTCIHYISVFDVSLSYVLIFFSEKYAHK